MYYGNNLPDIFSPHTEYNYYYYNLTFDGKIFATRPSDEFGENISREISYGLYAFELGYMLLYIE